MSLERKLIRIAKIIVAGAGTDFKIRDELYWIWYNLSKDNQYLGEEYQKFYHFHHLDDNTKEYDYQRRKNKYLNMLLIYCLIDGIALGLKPSEFSDDFIDTVYNNHKIELKQDIDNYKKKIEGLNEKQQKQEDKKTIEYIRVECEKIMRDLENVAVVTEPVHMFLTSDQNKKGKNYSLDDIKELIKLLDNGTSDNEELKKDVDNFLKKRIENTNKFIEKNFNGGNPKEFCDKIKNFIDLIPKDKYNEIIEKLKEVLNVEKELVKSKYGIQLDSE